MKLSKLDIGYFRLIFSKEYVNLKMLMNLMTSVQSLGSVHTYLYLTYSFYIDIHVYLCKNAIYSWNNMFCNV